jgi:hypothetical protein
LLTERYADRLAGVLSCYDRIIVTGTLPGACYAGGMTSSLKAHGIRIFDYPQFALPLRERIREGAQSLAQEHEVAIEHIAKAYIRKEDVVTKVQERSIATASQRAASSIATIQAQLAYWGMSVKR